MVNNGIALHIVSVKLSEAVYFFNKDEYMLMNHLLGKIFIWMKDASGMQVVRGSKTAVHNSLHEMVAEIF